VNLSFREHLVLELQGKKSLIRRFFDVFCAKGSKLIVAAASLFLIEERNCRSSGITY
jgi:hypothetical protein